MEISRNTHIMSNSFVLFFKNLLAVENKWLKVWAAGLLSGPTRKVTGTWLPWVVHFKLVVELYVCISFRPKAELSVGARALAKHHHRDQTDSWWGTSTGSKSVCLSVRWYACPLVICLSVSVSVFQLVCLSIGHLSVCVCLSVSVCLLVFCLSVCLLLPL